MYEKLFSSGSESQKKLLKCSHVQQYEDAVVEQQGRLCYREVPNL